MNLGFRGEVVDLYQRYRRGYPEELFDALVAVFGLTTDDVAVDLGCGTGQLAVPLAARVRGVIGVDPEPDMLVRARQVAATQGVTNLSWFLGADTDLPAVRALLGGRSVGLVTVGQALHWMDHAELFRGLKPLVRAGGGVAVVTNGTPLWLQDSDWSRALRECLEQWFGRSLTHGCGTDQAAQRRYHDSMVTAGFRVTATGVDYTGRLDVEQIVGGVLSALSVDRLPVAAERARFAERIHLALRPYPSITEQVHVAVLAGRIG